MFQTCLPWLVRCCCCALVLKICSTENAWRNWIWSLTGKADTCKQTIPKHVWHDGSNGPKCVCNSIFSLPVLQHKILGFNAVTLFSAMCEEVCLGSNPSPVAQLQKQMLRFKGELAVVGQKLARAGRFSCFHPTSRHDCFGFRALTLLSRKRSQRLLSRNSFMDDHKKLTTRSWWSIVEK